MGQHYVGVYVSPAAYDGPLQRDVDSALPAPEKATIEQLARGYRLVIDWAKRAGAQAARRASQARANGDDEAARAAEAVVKSQLGVGRRFRLVLIGETRAVKSIKPDAGDSTCPQFLDREARKQRGRLWPNIAASRAVGRTVAYATMCGLPAETGEIRRLLGDTSWRARRGIVAYAGQLIPLLDGREALSLLLDLNDLASERELAEKLGVRFRPMSEELDWLDDVPNAARAAGPERWVNMCLDRMAANGGKRTRDRFTGGEWNGHNRIKLHERVANLQAPAETDAAVQAAQAVVLEAGDILREAIGSHDAAVGQDSLAAMREGVREARAALREKAPRSLALSQLQILVARAAHSIARERKAQRLSGSMIAIDQGARAYLVGRLVKLLGSNQRPVLRRKWIEDFDLGAHGERAEVLARWLKPERKPGCRCCGQDLTEPTELANRLCLDCMGES
jgi:hypothetical protein